MISKEMYEFLKVIPRKPSEISYPEIEEQCGVGVRQIAEEAEARGRDYIYRTNQTKFDDCNFSLTDKGEAEVEEYERSMRNQEIVEKSLNVSYTAMQAAVASAVVAIVSLIASLIKLFV